MWMGTLSAIAAMIVGALFAAFTALQFSWGQVNWVTMLTAALLLTGGFRTLRKMSGVAAGLLLQSQLTPADLAGPQGSYSADLGFLTYPLLALPFIALAGVALTVLHKESK